MEVFLRPSFYNNLTLSMHIPPVQCSIAQSSQLINQLKINNSDCINRSVEIDDTLASFINLS